MYVPQYVLSCPHSCNLHMFAFNYNLLNRYLGKKGGQYVTTAPFQNNSHL